MTVFCLLGEHSYCQKNLLKEKSKSTYSSTYSKTEFPEGLAGTATVIYANESASSCESRLGGLVLKLKPSGLTFLNLQLRQEILNELRLQMEGVYEAQQHSHRAYPLLCDYFFFIQSNQDEGYSIDLQLVDAQTGEILWVFNGTSSDCEQVLQDLNWEF